MTSINREEGETSKGGGGFFSDVPKSSGRDWVRSKRRGHNKSGGRLRNGRRRGRGGPRGEGSLDSGQNLRPHRLFWVVD